MFVIGADDLELTFQQWRWVGTTPGEEKIPKLRHDRWEEVAAPKGGHGVFCSSGVSISYKFTWLCHVGFPVQNRGGGPFCG
jgi:hypothetical protein